MGILLAGANFDLFLDKIESLQRLADSADAENPLYRFVRKQTSWCVHHETFKEYRLRLLKTRYTGL